jgi:hypothetical protein
MFKSRLLLIPAAVFILGAILAVGAFVLKLFPDKVSSPVLNFTIETPEQLNSNNEKKFAVGGILELAKDISASTVDVKVYVKPGEEDRWWLGNAKCPATIENNRWRISSECLTFPMEYSVFTFLAVVVDVNKINELPGYVYPYCEQATDLGSLKQKIRQCVLEQNEECFSKVVEVRLSTLTPTLTPTPTSTPTSTPTQTPMLTPTSTPTPQSETTTTKPTPPTSTPTPTQIPTPLPQAVVVCNGGLNLRSGPGTIYDRIGFLSNGEILDIKGRIANKEWIQIVSVARPSKLGWASALPQYVQVNVDLDSIPIVEAPPTPTPKSTLTATPTLTPVLLPAPIPKWPLTEENALQIQTVEVGWEWVGRPLVGDETFSVNIQPQGFECPAGHPHTQTKGVTFRAEMNCPSGRYAWYVKLVVPDNTSATGWRELSYPSPSQYFDFALPDDGGGGGNGGGNCVPPLCP